MSVAVVSSLALLGCLAIAVPIAIHLFSKSKVVTIDFAPLALITARYSPRQRQVKLTELILLALRILIIVFATLLLAQLYFKPSTDTNTHTVFISQDWLLHANEQDKADLFALSDTANYSLISATPKTISATELASLLQQTANLSPAPVALNLWQLVAEQTAKLDKDAKVTVFSTNRLSQFIGAKIKLKQQVNWQIKALEPEKNAPLKAKLTVLSTPAQTAVLPYIKGAIAALNQQQAVTIQAEYQIINNANGKLTGSPDSLWLLLADNAQLKQQVNAQFAAPINIISLNEIGDIQHLDFPLQLAKAVFAQQQQQQWLQHGRLSPTQIQTTALSNAEQTTVNHTTSAQHQEARFWQLLLWVCLLLTLATERVLSEWPAARNVHD